MLASIKTLFTTFLEICLFQRGPQDLPASGIFLGIVFVISTFIALLLNLINLPFQQATVAVFINLAVVIIITQLILRLYNKPMRFVQTLTAQLGAGIVISVFAVPVVVMLVYAEKHDVSMITGIIFWLGLFVWETAVTAHILRHALSTNFFQGFLVAILYPLVYFQLIDFIFPKS